MGKHQLTKPVFKSSPHCHKGLTYYLKNNLHICTYMKNKSNAIQINKQSLQRRQDKQKVCLATDKFHL